MSREDWQINTIDKIFPDLYPKEVDSILDLACGISCKSKYLPAKIRIGVDIFFPYLEEAKKDFNGILMLYDIRDIDSLFLPNSFDIVLLLDVIEHLFKGDSLRLIEKAEKIARKAVVIETPYGFIPQNLDILGFGGHVYQTHRCGWKPKEFERQGYICKVRDYKMDDVKRNTHQEVDPNIKIIDAIKLL